MVLHNPNNWHWVNKDVAPWAKNYLDNELTQVSAEEDGVSAKIDKVVSMDGDVDVSQRKGKVITIFDVRVKLEYSGKNQEGEEASGTITIPEVAHDTEEDEYVFEVDVYSDEKSKQPVKDLVRSKILPQLRKSLAKLGPAVMAEHGKDIQHAPGSNPSSGFTTPKVYSSSSVNKPTSKSDAASQKSSSGAVVNVTTINDSTEFRTDAASLFQTFTDPQRIAAFTRSPPKTFTGAKPGGTFELFGGNVSGEYLELEEPTKTNWDQYYIRSIKTTFGFGSVL